MRPLPGSALDQNQLYLVHAGCPLVNGSVHDVHSVAGQTWQHHVRPLLLRIVVAARASVPARVVELVTYVRHGQSVYHLRIEYSTSHRFHKYSYYEMFDRI